jgi:FkbH-like protein
MGPLRKARSLVESARLRARTPALPPVADEALSGGVPADVRTWNLAEFRAPTTLQVTATPLRRVLVVGSCMVEGIPEWLSRVEPGCHADYLLCNNASDLPPDPPRPASEYDFQIVQIPLRSLVPEHEAFRLPFGDVAGFESLFEMSAARLRVLLDAGMVYNDRFGILTFVVNLVVPQADHVGRLMPRADLRNPAYFVRRLNDILAAEVDQRRNAYVLDVDEIASSVGRSSVQDDSIWSTLHGGVISDWDHARDQGRIEPPQPISASIPARGGDLLEVMWRECLAMFRTIRQIDAVKVVIVDLDDTLWRGVIAETREIGTDTTEGWPNGFVQALLELKRRGVLIAIVSKNDPAVINRIWPEIFQGKLMLEDFAVVKVNWAPKADNVEELLREINVLPGSALFIDDNPVERAAVQAAFPELRVLGQDPYEMRRVLLWAPETQVTSISEESGRRTEMVHAQIQREEVRGRMSREEFLRTLNVSVTAYPIDAVNHERFARALELINKTNQFNSTGERWTLEVAADFFAQGGQFVAFEVRDAFAQYGLTAVAIVMMAQVRQVVMSCRVFGLDVERAVFRCLQERLDPDRRDGLEVRFVATPANSLVVDALERCGFASRGEWWEAAPAADFAGTARLEVAG